MTVSTNDVSARGGGDTSESSAPKTVRVQEQKEKLQAELQTLWVEQCDQLKKKKEQFATEVHRGHSNVVVKIIRVEAKTRPCPDQDSIPRPRGE